MQCVTFLDFPSTVPLQKSSALQQFVFVKSLHMQKRLYATESKFIHSLAVIEAYFLHAAYDYFSPLPGRTVGYTDYLLSKESSGYLQLSTTVLPVCSPV